MRETASRRIALANGRVIRANAAMLLRPAALCGVLVLGSLHAQREAARDVRLHVHNPAGVQKRERVSAPVPFARGELEAPAPGEEIVVNSFAADAPDAPRVETVGTPRVLWPDGSVAVLAVALPIDVAANASRTYRVAVARNADGEPRTRSRAPVASPWPSALPFTTELVDPWGRTLTAKFAPDQAVAKDGVVLDEGARRVVRFRATHRLALADGRELPLLDAVVDLATFAESRRAELTVMLDNRDPACGPLGPVRFSAFRLVSHDARTRFLPLFAHEQRLPPPAPRADGSVAQDLVPDGRHYLGDGTAKSFRLHLFLDDESASGDERELARWSAVRCCATPDVDDLRRTRAFGAFGGPAPVLEQDLGDVQRRLQLWQANARLGVFGNFGDPEDPRIGGAPRHGDSVLHDVVRWRSPHFLVVAEGMVLQHSLRPTGGREPRLPKDTAPYRAGLQAQATYAPHGRPRFDYEHMAAGLVYDWWWLTGDPFAQDELRRIGASVRAMLPAVPFRTSRGEGRCLEAGALAALATGDRELADFLVDHALQRTSAAMAKEGNLVAIPQPPHPLVLDGATPFDTTSQMAALVRGLAALHRVTGDARLVPVVERVADAMAGGAFAGEAGPKTLLGAEDRSRYSFAASPEDRSGSDRTLIGAFLIAAELTAGTERAALFRQRAAFLLQRELGPAPEVADLRMAMANPWLQIAFDRRKQP